MTTRAAVFLAIDAERQYQDQVWNTETTTSGGKHEPEAFLLYIEHYVALARTALSTQSLQVAYPEAQHIFRKIAALCVAEMEQHGAESVTRLFTAAPKAPYVNAYGHISGVGR